MPRPLDFQDAEERYASAAAVAAAFAPQAEAQLPVALPPGGIPAGEATGPVLAQAVPMPRDIGRIFQQIAAMAAAAGNDWYYSFPAKDRATGKSTDVEGPSIKAAMNVARIYGNCMVDSRVVDAGESWIIYAKFIDYETGFTLVRPYQQRKGQTAMGSAGRQSDMVFSIGVSKALRNVITNALESFTDFAFDEAKGSVVEKIGKKLDFYRGKVGDRLRELGVDVVRVERLIGRKIAEMLAHDIAKVIAEIQAVADGMSSPDDIWPGDAPPRPTPGPGQSFTRAAPPRPQPTNPMAGRPSPAAQQDQRPAAPAADTPAAADEPSAGDAEFASWGDTMAADSAPAGDDTVAANEVVNLTIPLAKTAKGYPDWVRFAKEFLAGAEGAGVDGIRELEAANSETLDRMKLDDPVGFDRLTEKLDVMKDAANLNNDN